MKANLLSSTLGGVTANVRRNDHTSALVYNVGAGTQDPMNWIRTHHRHIREHVRVHGLCLLRGLPVDVDAFYDVVAAVGGEPMGYTERSSPRTKVGRNIYTSTDYPQDQRIPMHNENSYSDRWPATLFFLCHTPSATGGATPIADSRVLLRLIPNEVRDRFASGVTYTRTFREGLGLSWQEVFQTGDRAIAETYCSDHGIEFEWVDEGMRTRHRRPAVQIEPHTGQAVWFNQANLFHVSSLDPEVREVLRSSYDEQDQPRNAYLGNGEQILDDDIRAIEAAYAQASLTFAWQAGDVLVVNNMLMAHGRQPYTGSRRILVAMS